MPIQKYEDFSWWLNLNQATNIKDNELKIAKNMFYNKEWQLQSRRGYRKFGDQIGANPITSYFFHKRTDTLERIAICFSWGSMYKYDGTNWNSAKTNLLEYETLPWSTSNRTRWDFEVYKDDIYMCDGVNLYAKYDWTTYTTPWTWWPNTCTFDNTTNYVEDTAHWLSAWDEVYFTNSWGALPAEITEYQVYYVLSVDADNFQISTSPAWDALAFTDDGTGTNSYFTVSEPRYRYLHMFNNTMFWAGVDQAPSTLYYSNTAAANMESVDTNFAVIGKDDNGRINALNDFWQVIIVYKEWQPYSFDLWSEAQNPIDTQAWWYADRSVRIVGNNQVYFSERGIDTLIKRMGVWWVSSLEWKPFSDNVRKLLEQIEEKQYNASCSWHIKKLNNYYFSFDLTDDNVPETHLVYNSKEWAYTQYIYPPIYDYWYYETSTGEIQHLFASGSGGQMYQMEYWYTDNGVAIETEAETKDFEFKDPAQEKIFEMVDVTGYKQEWWDLDIKVIIDGDVVTLWTVTDSNIDTSEAAGMISVDALSEEVIGWVWPDDLPIYRFTVKIPFYHRGTKAAVNLSASGVQRILEKIRIKVNWEVETMFSYNNIL